MPIVGENYIEGLLNKCRDMFLAGSTVELILNLLKYLNRQYFCNMLIFNPGGGGKEFVYVFCLNAGITSCACQADTVSVIEWPASRSKNNPAAQPISLITNFFLFQVRHFDNN